MAPNIIRISTPKSGSDSGCIQKAFCVQQEEAARLLKVDGLDGHLDASARWSPRPCAKYGPDGDRVRFPVSFLGL
jgi:hypothetical protein